MTEVSHARRLENKVSALMRKQRLLEAIALLRLDERSEVEQDWRLCWKLGW
jgi:hypothetical protein